MSQKKLTPDWERIEVAFRAGVMSLREIASANSVSHVAIVKRAKKEGWERDLKAKIQAKADALVNKQAVTAEVNAQKAAVEREVVEANAAQIARIRGEHRSDIGRARALVVSLLSELEAATGGVEVFRELGEYLAAPGENGMDKLNEAYHKVISLPSRVSSMKGVTEALKNLVALEREAYGIVAHAENEAHRYEDSLRELAQSLPNA